MIKFTKEDIGILEKAKCILLTKIIFSEDPGGRLADCAYTGILGLLEVPEIRAISEKELCKHCGRIKD